MDQAFQGVEIDMPIRSVRILFRWSGDHIEVEDQQLVDMIAPKGDDFDTSNTLGMWHEVKDDLGSVLYRRRMHLFGQGHLEVPSGDGTFVRQPIENDDRLHMILIPALPAARSMTVYSQTVEDQAGTPPRGRLQLSEPVRRELLTVDLRREP